MIFLPLMLQLVATACIVLVGSAISVYGPMILRRPAHLLRAPRQTTAVTGVGAVDRVVDVLRRRPSARVGLTAVSSGLLVGAVAWIGYPFWTNLVQSRIQSRLDRELASPELREDYLNGRIGVGDSLTRIRIPDLDVDVIVVEGTTASALRAGAGHYPETPLPCEIGNVAIAGHRTTYGRPFHSVDLLEPGDEIILETPIGECTYEVKAEPFVVEPTDVQVVENTPDEAMLTLTSCHPKGSARQRIIVQATMTHSDQAAR